MTPNYIIYSEKLEDAKLQNEAEEAVMQELATLNLDIDDIDTVELSDESQFETSDNLETNVLPLVESILGILEDDTYINSEIGYSFTLTDEWQYVDYAMLVTQIEKYELKEQVMSQLDSGNSVVFMQAIAPDGTNVVMFGTNMNEPVPNINESLESEEDFLRLFEDSLKEGMELGGVISVDFVDYVPVVIDGDKHMSRR